MSEHSTAADLARVSEFRSEVRARLMPKERNLFTDEDIDGATRIFIRWPNPLTVARWLHKMAIAPPPANGVVR